MKTYLNTFNGGERGEKGAALWRNSRPKVAAVVGSGRLWTAAVAAVVARGGMEKELGRESRTREREARFFRFLLSLLCFFLIGDAK